MTWRMRVDGGWAVAVVIHVLAGVFFLVPSYIRPDSVAIMAWLRSLVFDRDLLFFNEWAGFGMIVDGFTVFKEVTPLGTLANHWWIGTSILLAPVYLVARIVDAVTGVGNGTGGFFGFYAVALSWGVVLLGTITWIVGDRLLDELCGLRLWMRTILLALLWLGTPLFWNEFRLPLGTHIPGALGVGILTFLLVRQLRGESSHWIDVAIGLALGMAIATRIQHFVLIPAVAFAALAMKRSVASYLRVAAGAATPLAAQALAWWIVYGTPAGPLTGGANLGGTTWMPFATINLAPVIVSSYHGLFTWAPLTALAILGWLVAVRGRDRTVAWVMILMFTGEWLANAVFDRYFWGGTSFGPRRFVDLAVPFAVGLGWLVLRWPKTAAIGGAVCATWGAGLTLAAMSGKLELARDIGPAQLVAAVFSGLDPRSWSAAMVRSAVVDVSLRFTTLTAILIVVVVAGSMFFLLRTIRIASIMTMVFLGIALLAIGISAGPTRRGTERAIESYGIDLRVARSMGPLLDQQKLLRDELAFRIRTGQQEKAMETGRLIAEVDRAVGELRSK